MWAGAPIRKTQRTKAAVGNSYLTIKIFFDNSPEWGIFVCFFKASFGNPLLLKMLTSDIKSIQ